MAIDPPAIPDFPGLMRRGHPDSTAKLHQPSIVIFILVGATSVHA